eukprot:5675228-Pyramimonas_sp.AAC.2
MTRRRRRTTRRREDEEEGGGGRRQEEGGVWQLAVWHVRFECMRGGTHSFAAIPPDPENAS